jgi:hypothetical protein
MVWYDFLLPLRPELDGARCLPAKTRQQLSDECLIGVFVVCDGTHYCPFFCGGGLRTHLCAAGLCTKNHTQNAAARKCVPQLLHI